MHPTPFYSSLAEPLMQNLTKVARLWIKVIDAMTRGGWRCSKKGRYELAVMGSVTKTNLKLFQ